MPFKGPYHFCLEKNKTPFPFSKYGKILSSHRPPTAPPPRPAPPSPRKSENQLSPGEICWLDDQTIRKKYGVWIEPTPVKNWKHFILRPHSIYRQLTSNSAKVSFISCILVWVILKGCGFCHPKVVSNWMRSKPSSVLSLKWDIMTTLGFLFFFCTWNQSLLASVHHRAFTTLELSITSPCLWAWFHSPPIPSFSENRKVIKQLMHKVWE